MDRNKVLEQIKKCFALAGGSTNEGEVEAALAAARRLMDKYDVSEAEVQLKATREENATKVVETEGFKRAGSLEAMDMMLAQGVATLCHCVGMRLINKMLGEERMIFIGFQRDTAIAAALCEQLRIVMRSLARGKLGKKWSSAHVQYCYGFATRIFYRAQDLVRTSAPNTGAIVLCKSDAIAAYRDQKYKSVKPGKPVKINDSEAYLKGYSDGGNVALTTNSLEGGSDANVPAV